MTSTGISLERNPAMLEKADNVLFEEANGSDRSSNEFTWTDEEETAVRRKLDKVIVPLTTFLYLLCFLDRANVGNARIQGMGKELNLDTGVRFNWVTSIFYIIYMFVEVPSNIILKIMGPKWYLPMLVVGFGLVSMCTAFVRSFEGLLAARAMLGVFEGGVMPGLAFFITCFYKRNELLFRIGIYVSAASMAGAFGGLLATGLSRIPPWGISSMVIHTWRNIFFFEGLFTILIGVGAPFLMPSSPQECWFLTERERMIASQRLISKSGDETEKIRPHHVKRAVFNITNYFCALGFFFINITVQGISLFMPTILRDLGWTATKAQLYSVPPYVCACLVAIGVAFVSDKTNRRGLYLAIFTLPAIAGFAIMRWAKNPDVRYGGIFLITIGAFPGGPGFLAWAANNAAGPAVRSVSTAYVVTLGTAGGILATWTYVSKEQKKGYPTGHTINLCGQICVLLLACAGIAYCKWENRQRNLGKRDHRLNGLNEEQIKDLGYRHPEFRYIH